MSHWNVQPHVSINEVATLQLRPTFHYVVVIYMCGIFVVWGLNIRHHIACSSMQHAGQIGRRVVLFGVRI